MESQESQNKIPAFLKSWESWIDYYSPSKQSLEILGFHVKPRNISFLESFESQ